jgi:hypothetical protein
MYNEFERDLFATVLLAMAVVLSLTSVARFPAVLQPASPPRVGQQAVQDDASEALLSSLR